MSLNNFYRIQNHDDGYHHYKEKVRQYRYELVDKIDDNCSCHIYGYFRYVNSPHFIHQGFYHVKESDLSEVWWKVPSASEQLEITARYPDALF